jgi:hypothetical protein
MTAPQIPQCNNKKFGAYLAFPPIYMWPFGMQTPSAMRHLPQAQLSFVLIPQFSGNFFLKKEALFRGNDGVQRVKIFQAPKLLAFVAYEIRAECRQTGSIACSWFIFLSPKIWEQASS